MELKRTALAGLIMMAYSSRLKLALKTGRLEQYPHTSPSKLDDETRMAEPYRLDVGDSSATPHAVS